MSDQYTMEQEEIFSKVMRAGRRTYFFDVRSTKAGDFYLTVTESKKFTNDDGSYHYKKHKIYLYKEDFSEFKDTLDEMINYVIDEKGEEVISERHQKDYKPAQPIGEKETDEMPIAAEPASENDETDSSNFTDIEFDDI
ncbi:MAG: PUR family DNA/RNA-binding protein [Flavobacteriaceae bacterium]|nr:PUR family DNA/RNA-binding protein [Flavobacteriaceae bacterium]